MNFYTVHLLKKTCHSQQKLQVDNSITFGLQYIIIRQNTALVCCPSSVIALYVVGDIISCHMRTFDVKVEFIIAVVRESILCVIGRAAGFQVTDEFIAQLPQQLIVPSSHLQLFESIGEGKLQTSHGVCAC